MHPYGKLNLYEQKNQFNEYVQKLRWVIYQYKNWTVGEKDVIMNRYLNLLKVGNIIFKLTPKDQVQLGVTLNEQIRKCLDKCQQQGQQHLSSKEATIATPSTTTQQNMLHQLQLIAERLELQYFVEYPTLSELPQHLFTE